VPPSSFAGLLKLENGTKSRLFLNDRFLGTGEASIASVSEFAAYRVDRVGADIEVFGGAPTKIGKVEGAGAFHGCASLPAPMRLTVNPNAASRDTDASQCRAGALDITAAQLTRSA
jgi:hypothetical protein